MDMKVEQLANGIMVLVVAEDGKQETLVFNDAGDAGDWFRSNFKFGMAPKRDLGNGGYTLFLKDVRSDKVITNIKLVRELTGLGLKEAKDVVDASRATGEALLMSVTDDAHARAVIDRFGREGFSSVVAR